MARWLTLITALALVAWVSSYGTPEAPSGGHPATPPLSPAPLSPAPLSPAHLSAAHRPAAHPIGRDAGSTGPRFDQRIERLATLRLAVEDARERGDPEEAAAAVATTEAAWAELRANTLAPGDKALTRLLAADPECAPLDHPRREVLLATLAAGLAARSRDAEATGDRGPLDYLTAATLAAIAHRPGLRDQLAGLLVDRPYLGLRHEDAVDRLVRDSRSPAERITASALLDTLWANLVATDARTEAEITALALLYRDDARPARRLSAMRHLLHADRGRYRRSVHRQVVRERDQWLAGQLGIEARALFGAR